MAGNAQNIIVGAATMTVNGVDVGYTKGGVTIRHDKSTLEVMADQTRGAVRKALTLERLFVKTTLLEVTLNNLRRAFMYPSSSITGGNTLNLGYNDACWVDEVSIVLVGPGPSCGTATFTLNRCVMLSNFELSLQRDAEAGIEVEFECLKDSSGKFGTLVYS